MRPRQESQRALRQSHGNASFGDDLVDDPNASDGKTSAYTRYVNVLKEALKVDWSSLPSN